MTDPTTAATTLTGDNGSAAPQGGAPAAPQNAWYGQVDEQTAAYITNKGWDAPSKLIESYRNLEKFAGGSKSLVELPGVDADDDARNAFFDKIGRPANPDEYGIKPQEGEDTALLDWFTKTAHAQGLTTQQAKAMYEKWNEFGAQYAEAQQTNAAAAAEKQIGDLKREWGADFDKNVTAGKQAVNALGFTQDELSSLESKLGTGEMLKLFTRLGSRMMEPDFNTESRSGAAGGFGTSAAQAQQQINELKSDKAFMDQYMNGNKDAVAKMTRLMGVAYAG